MNIMEMLRRERIIAIIRGVKLAYMLDLADALQAGGITMMEITFDQFSSDSWRDTMRSIETVSAADSTRAVGAGTVMTVEQVQMAHEAGAKFIISPNVCEAVIKETKRLGMISIPGALTPTEATFAHECGADVVKIFPAANMGTGYIKAISAPLVHINFIAVGGVNEKNARDFLLNGAIGVGVGGNLINKTWIENGEMQRIVDLAKEYARAVR